MITDLEQKIITLLQHDFPLTPDPFRQLALQLGLTEAALLDHLRRLQDEGVIRSFRAILEHRQAGFTANAMVVWRVPPGRVAEVGRIMASFPEVSHCYERETSADWPYNLYTMLHGRDRGA